MSGFPNNPTGNGFKHNLDNPISIISVNFWNNTPFPSYCSSPFLTLTLCFLFSTLFPPFFPTISFVCPHPLYSLSLVGFKSLLFYQFPCNPTFTQNPKKQSCLLKILLKLVLDTKLHSAANSPKALTTLGN